MKPSVDPGSSLCRVTDISATQPTGQPPQIVHLLEADDAIAEGHRYGTFIAVCGELVRASNLSPSPCPDGCHCENALYCPECVREATRWDAEAGQSAEAELVTTAGEHLVQADGAWHGVGDRPGPQAAPGAEQ